MKHITTLHIFTFGLTLLALISCGKKGNPVFGPDPDDIVINEIMASNKTGLAASDGHTHDWIELRNTSKHDINLSDYSLAKDSGRVSWTFPDTILHAKECLLVFATSKALTDELHCDFRLSREGETLQLLSPDSTVLQSVTYDKLKDDQAYKRTKEGNYKKTYKQTPGFKNGDEGRAAFLAFMAERQTSPLLIWEYICRDAAPRKNNENSLRWVELKNVSSEPVDLSPYYLTSEKDSVDILSLPNRKLAPGALLLVKDVQKRLTGDCVMLYKGSIYVDGLNARKTYIGVSIGRQKDSLSVCYFDQPTPNEENTSAAYTDITDEPSFKTRTGAFEKDSMTVEITTDDNEVHYTLDGSWPTSQSPLYTGPIHISRTSIIRAFAQDSTSLRSQTVTASYILGVDHQLPIVSLVVDTADLFNHHTGIYVKGPHAQPEEPNKGANFWKPWEKLAHIEFIDGDKGFSYYCGLKIFGAYSRARQKKSFQIKFRNRYGHSPLKYDFYGLGHKDEMKSFVLRSGSQDDIGVMVRDEFFTRLMDESSPTLHVQHYRPVVLYINGKYWGLYYIREKINEYFVANHLGVDPKTAHILQGTGSEVNYGSNRDYRALQQYIRSHDMSKDEAYSYVEQRLDVQSLIDYKIGEFYTGNADVGNIRFFKSDDPSCNQKWHWLFYDLDWGFYYPTPLSYYIREDAVRASGERLAPFNMMVSRLLRNKRFRQLFLDRWTYHHDHTFNPDHALPLFDEMIATIQPEMERNCKRWPQVMGYQTWQRNVKRFRNKINTVLPRLNNNVHSEIK